MTFCPQFAPGTISLTSDWVLGDDTKQYRCYIGKIVNKQNIIRDRTPRSRFSYAYTLGLLPYNTVEDAKIQGTEQTCGCAGWSAPLLFAFTGLFL